MGPAKADESLIPLTAAASRAANTSAMLIPQPSGWWMGWPPRACCKRSKGRDGRSVDLSLTRTGKKEFERLREKRRKAVSEVIDALSKNEQTQLTHLAELLLERLTRDRASGRSVLGASLNCFSDSISDPERHRR